MTLLQQQVKRRLGISSSEFYRIAMRARFMVRAMKRLAAEQEIIERHISADEWRRWKHRDGAAVARLAAMRSRRA